MNEIRKPKATKLANDEKTSLVMIYTANALLRGQVITKESIRVSIWLRTQSAPEYIHLLKGNLLTFGAGATRQSTFPELILPTSEVLAYHLAPPAHDPMDYDESEANRVMEPITALVGTFRFDGHIRLSIQSDAITSLTVARSPWLSLYHVAISNPLLSSMGTLKVPMVLIRPTHTIFGMDVETAPGDQSHN